MDAAARLVEQLETEGKRMRFDTDRLSGRVVASLLHPDGAIAPLALADAVSPERAADATGSGRGGRMTGIQLTGLASGLDTESIISQLMAVESQPRTVISNKQASAQARQTALQDIQSKLTLLKTATTALSSVTTWGNSQTVESTDTTKATVRTVAGASPGGHQLVVSQLARGAQATYAYSAPSGPVTVNGVAVTIPAGASLDDAVTAINDADYPDGEGVFAVNVNGKLAISARTTGSASQASVTGLGTQTASTAGLDAQGTVDGAAFTSSSNMVTDALPGVEVTLKGVTDATGISLIVGNPGPNPDNLVSAVKGFVSAYNSVVDAVRSRVTEQRVPNAASASDAAKGSLFGDSGLSGMLDSLRRRSARSPARRPTSPGRSPISASRPARRADGQRRTASPAG